MTLQANHGGGTVRRARTALAVALLVCVAGLVTAAPAQAGTYAVKGAKTRLTAAGGLWFGLGDNFHIFPYAPSTVGLTPGSIWYDTPVTGGSFDFRRAIGTVKHRGGMFFVRTWWAPGWVQCAYRDWRITFDTNPRASAVFLDGFRHPFLQLNTGGMTTKRWTAGERHYLRLSGIGATWANEAVDAMNVAFGMSYPYGETFGTLTITLWHR